MDVPIPTPIYRIVHVDNLPILLRRGGLHAPNNQPDDGLSYKTIHDTGMQFIRRCRTVYCGPGGVIHDYIPFYFGPRSPMLYRLHTGWGVDYHEGQEPLIYIVSSVQKIIESNLKYVFSDGHGIARITNFYDDVGKLNEVDWESVYAKYWKDEIDHMDRERRKQAEFLVYLFCDWNLVGEIGVLNTMMKEKVKMVFDRFDTALRKDVHIRHEWYY